MALPVGILGKALGISRIAAEPCALEKALFSVSILRNGESGRV